MIYSFIHNLLIIFYLFIYFLLFLGIEALTLDYIVTFPLSLVISRKALTKYQLLFRHLLYLKYIEQLLCNTWTEHVKSFYWRRGSGHPSLEAWKSRSFALRQRMLVFVQQFAYYVTSEVLEPQWRNLEANLVKVDQSLFMIFIYYLLYWIAYIF